MRNPAELINHISPRTQRIFMVILVTVIALFLAFFHLTDYPKPWFDEGSHLHVPKTLVRYGVYADYSSEGFRYYGPTIGVGPTVMLPIAAAFKTFGIGLLQARVLMATYLLATIYVYYRVVRDLSVSWLAMVACALLISSRSVLILNYGRQVLGEVPGLLFLLLGIAIWFRIWETNTWKRLLLVGLLFGLAIITKYQYMLFLLPMIGLAWLANMFYYKITPHKNFIIPGVVALVCFGIWQVITVQYMGPATALENFALLRASAAGAAFNFNLGQIGRNVEELTSRSVYMGALFPAMIYGFIISLPRNRDSQKWGVFFILIALNLVWFIISSIGWIRYAFLGLALSGIFIARLFFDVTDGFQLHLGGNQVRQYLSSLLNVNYAYRWALIAWLVAIIVVPMGKNVVEIVSPVQSGYKLMAAYLNENIPKDATIETWDPEMGFLTDHTYHYPPNPLLAIAVQQVYSGGESVQGSYNYVQTDQPEYLLLGEFSKWVNLYPIDQLTDQYSLVKSIGGYDLYKRIK